MDSGPFATKNLVAKVLSDADGKRDVEAILTAQKERVGALLEANRDIVEALRDALIQRDELVGEAIVEVIERALDGRATARRSSRGDSRLRP
jgi:ATP-dependent Zn protease